MAVVVDILAEQIDRIVVATLQKFKRELLRQAKESYDFFPEEVDAILEALNVSIDYFSPQQYTYGYSGTPIYLSQGLCEKITIDELEAGIEINKEPNRDEGGELIDSDMELINSLEIAREYILSA